jgi:hypothetical protein
MEYTIYREQGTNQHGRLLAICNPELEENHLQSGEIKPIGLTVSGTPERKPILGASCLGFAQAADYLPTPLGDALVCY